MVPDLPSQNPPKISSLTILPQLQLPQLLREHQSGKFEITAPPVYFPEPPPLPVVLLLSSSYSLSAWARRQLPLLMFSHLENTYVCPFTPDSRPTSLTKTFWGLPPSLAALYFNTSAVRPNALRATYFSGSWNFAI